MYCQSFVKQKSLVGDDKYPTWIHLTLERDDLGMQNKIYPSRLQGIKPLK